MQHYNARRDTAKLAFMMAEGSMALVRKRKRIAANRDLSQPPERAHPDSRTLFECGSDEFPVSAAAVREVCLSDSKIFQTRRNLCMKAKAQLPLYATCTLLR